MLLQYKNIKSKTLNWIVHCLGNYNISETMQHEAYTLRHKVSRKFKQAELIYNPEEL